MLGGTRRQLIGWALRLAHAATLRIICPNDSIELAGRARAIAVVVGVVVMHYVIGIVNIIIDVSRGHCF